MVTISIHCDFCGQQFEEHNCFPADVLKKLGEIKARALFRKWAFFNHRYYCPSCAEKRGQTK